MRTWTRRWIATCRLARATSTRCAVPRRPAWSRHAPTAPPILKDLLSSVQHTRDPALPRQGDPMATNAVTADGRARVLADGNQIPMLGLGVWQVPGGPASVGGARGGARA